MAEIETTFDPDHDLVSYKVTGKVVADELVDRVKACPPGRRPLRRIWDMRDSDLSGFSAEELRQVIKRVKALAVPGPVTLVAVVSAGDLNFGLSRMYSAYAEGIEAPLEYGSFRSLADAREWLGIGA